MEHGTDWQQHRQQQATTTTTATKNNRPRQIDQSSNWCKQQKLSACWRKNKRRLEIYHLSKQTTSYPSSQDNCDIALLRYYTASSNVNIQATNNEKAVTVTTIVMAAVPFRHSAARPSDSFAFRSMLSNCYPEFQKHIYIYTTTTILVMAKTVSTAFHTHHS